MNVLEMYWHWFIASAVVFTLLGYWWLVDDTQPEKGSRHAGAKENGR